MSLDRPTPDSLPPALRVWMVGGSVRAAAQSAKAAGLSVIATDRFADQDLQESADDVIAVRRWSELPSIAEQIGHEVDAWCALGPLENQPSLLQRIGKSRAVASRVPLHPSPDQIVRVRDRRSLRDLLVHVGLPTLDETTTLPTGELLSNWLLKPTKSGGGLGIQRPQSRAAPPGWYFQRHAIGEEWSLAFVGDGRRAYPLYAARPWPHSPGDSLRCDFLYRGSIAPLAPPSGLRESLQTLADSVASAVGVRGLFGIDAVWDGRQAWVLEINPRYTASMELFDLVSGDAVMRLHVDAYRGQPIVPMPAVATTSRPARVAGKLVLYADRPLRGTTVVETCGQIARSYGLQLADIPRGNSQCSRGDPLTTLIGWDTDADALVARMTAAEREWQQLIPRVARSG